MSQKRSYVHVPEAPATVPAVTCDPCSSGGRYRAGIQGGYTGWGGEGYTGYYPAARGDLRNQRSGPRKPLQGAGVGGFLRSGALGDGGGSQDHPSGPVGHPWYPPCPGTLIAASQPKGRELTSFPLKLVKTRKCHQKVVKRPVIVPILQNGSRKSPLDFLGFPYFTAFSHKELIGSF